MSRLSPRSPPPYTPHPLPHCDSSSTEDDVEPGDEWKQNLKRRIRDNIQSMIDEAKKSLLIKMEQNPEGKDEILKEYFARVPPNPRRMAEETYVAELERERQERRQRLRESGTHGSTASSRVPTARPKAVQQVETGPKKESRDPDTIHAAGASASPPFSHPFNHPRLDVEPDEGWKRDLKQRIQDNLQLVIESAKEALYINIRQNPESKDELLYNHVANVIPNLRCAANDIYIAEVEQERKERLRAHLSVLQGRPGAVDTIRGPPNSESAFMYMDTGESLINGPTLPVQGRPLPNLPISEVVLESPSSPSPTRSLRSLSLSDSGTDENENTHRNHNHYERWIPSSPSDDTSNPLQGHSTRRSNKSGAPPSVTQVASSGGSSSQRFGNRGRRTEKHPVTTSHPRDSGNTFEFWKPPASPEVDSSVPKPNSRLSVMSGITSWRDCSWRHWTSHPTPHDSELKDQFYDSPIGTDGISPEQRSPISQSPEKSFPGFWKPPLPHTDDEAKSGDKRNGFNHTRHSTLDTLARSASSIANNGQPPRLGMLSVKEKFRKQFPGDDPPYSAAADSSRFVLDLMKDVLKNKLSYKKLLDYRGEQAHRILDIMQKFLDDQHSVDYSLKRSVLVATLRLCAASGEYPRCLSLHGVRRDSRPVAEGRFGDIWRGYFKDREVCLKVMKLYQNSQVEHLVKCFAREAIMWSQLSHPNLLPFYGIYHMGDEVGRVCLVSPWMADGNISDYLKANTEVPRLPLVHDILAGLAHLHEYSIVHGDLKGVNILITSTGTACLADFGLSSVVDADIVRWTSLETMTRTGGTIRWEAPELLDDSEEEDCLLRPTLLSDMYSVASVMYEVLTGLIPYHECTRDATVISKVIRGIRPTRPSPELEGELSDAIWEVMQECWSHIPSNRPTVEEVIERLRQGPPSRLTVKRLNQQKKRKKEALQFLTPVSFRAAMQGDDIKFSEAELVLLENLVC